jgi:hypothetical protein
MLQNVKYVKWQRQKRRPKKALTQTRNPEIDGALKEDHLSLGLRVYVNNFECGQRGQTCDYYVKAPSKQYKVWRIFVDHALSYIYGEHHFGFSDKETSRVKQSYERMCLANGVFAQDYLNDSGAFKIQQVCQTYPC